MYVVGATKATFLTEIRKIVPESFCWYQGRGTGRQFIEVCKYGMNDNVGLLVNSLKEELFTPRPKRFCAGIG